MSKTRIHIDQLFSNGLEKLEIPISVNSFDTIKKDIGTEDSIIENNSSFKNFEIAVTDDDWQIIKERLAKANLKNPAEAIENSLKQLELAVSDNDWEIVKERLAQKDHATVLPIPMDSMRSSFKDFEIAVTDGDWKAIKSKLNNFNQKKMVWWWWLNIAFIGTLLGLVMNYYAPLSISSTSIASAFPNSSTIKNSNSKHPEVLNRKSMDSKNSNFEKHVSKQLQTPFKKDLQLNTNKSESKNYHSSTFKNSNQNNYTKTDNKLPLVVDKSESNLPNNNVSKKEIEVTIPKADIYSELNNGTKGDNSAVLKNNSQNIKPLENIESTIKNSETNLNQITTVSENFIDTPKKTDPVTSSTIIPPPGAAQLKFYAGITTEIAMTYRVLSNDNNEMYNKIRNNAELPIVQFSYGVTAGILKGKNQLQTGIQFTEQNFVSNYNFSYAIYDSIPLYGPPPTYVFKGYFLFKKRDTIINSQENISIKKIEIPINYNRTWKLDAKTQLITGISAIMGVNTKTEGTLALNPLNNQLFYYHLQQSHERKFGLSPGLNVGIQRNLGKNLLIQGNAFGKYSVTNRYTNDYTVKENLYSYGLSIKLLYLLK